MATKNRFKSTGPKVNFDDPSVLTAVPDHIEDSPVEKEVVKEKVKETDVVSEPVQEATVVQVVEQAEVVKLEEKIVPTAEKEKSLKENLLAGIVEQKIAAKTYAIYLDTDVVAALDKLAKQNKVSRSKALNSLLRNILIK